MNKYLFPIKNLKIDRYLKWWLLYNDNKKQGVLSDILEGYSFTLNDSLRKKFKIFDMVGNSVQDGTPTPENPIEIKSCGDNVNIFNKELAQDKKYQNISGNYDIVTHSITWITGLQPIKSSKNYVLNYQVQTGAFYDENQNAITTSTIYQSKTFQSPSNAKYVNLTFLPAVLAFDDKNKLKLEEGSQASGYSPYGMGSISELINTKNLYKITGKTSQGITGSLEDNGYLKVSGTATSSYADVTNFTKKKLPAGTYIFSISNSQSFRIGMKVQYFDNTTLDSQIVSGTTSVSFTATKEIKQMRVFIDAYGGSGTTINSSFGVMVSKTGGEWKPYEERTYTIPTQQPMRSIGDVRDGFAKVNGVWNEVHNIYRKILDGTESWNLSNNVFYITDISNYLSSTGKICLCNKYFAINNTNAGTSAITQNNSVCFFTQNNNPRLYIRDERFTTVADFKSWLAQQYANGTPVYVDYILAEPTYLPCTEEQIAILDNIPSTYKEQTNIISLDEVEAYLKIQYYKKR